MNIPGFTAEASLDRTNAAYQVNALLNRNDAHVYPAQSQLTNRDYFSPISLRWPILEPNCVRICLPWWGGHCRWICY